jgi:replication factor A1
VGGSDLLTLEETIELILKNMPEYQRQDILKMIDEKRQELGPEVVNEESAAMIVARELGIDLQQVSAKARLRIEDINESTRSVALTGKVVSIGQVRTFSRKGEGGEGKVASIVVADETGQMRVALWDDITRIVTDNEVKVGDVIQIRGGYVRPGLGGALEINLGRQGGIKLLDEYELEDIDVDFKDAGVTEIAGLKENIYDITLVAKIQKVFGLSTFTRQKDGTEGKVLSMIVGDETGTTRLVFWDDDAEAMQDSKDGEVIRVTGAYTKAGRYGDIEVHAGRSSNIERGLKVKIDAVEPESAGRPAAEPLGKKSISELTPEMRDVDIAGKVAKIFPITTFERDGKEGKVQNIVVADESGSIRMTFWNDDVDKIEDLKEGDIIKVLHGYVKKGFRDAVEFHAGRTAEIAVNPKGTKLEQLDLSDVSLPSRAQAGRVMIAEIDENTAGKSVEVCGVIVGLSQTSPVYPACPSCRKKVEEADGKFTCSVCGTVKSPEYRMLYKVTLDDGSGAIRATLFGKAGEDLLQMTAEEARKLIEKSGDNLAPLEKNSDKVLGRYVAIQGRVSKFRDSLDITANNLEFADPVEEVKRMKDTLSELMG